MATDSNRPTAAASAERPSAASAERPAAASASATRPAGSAAESTTATSESATSGAATGNPDDVHIQRLQANFRRQFGLVQPPGGGGVPPAGDIQAMQQQASQLRGQGPRAVLTDEQRKALSGKRFPSLHEILRRCGAGVALHGQITQDTQVSETSCRLTIDVDAGAAQIIKGADEAHISTGDAIRLVAKDASDKGALVLTEVDRRIRGMDPRIDPGVLAVQFDEATRLFRKDQQRAQYAKDGQVSGQNADAGKSTAAEEGAQAIDRFLLNEKNQTE